MVCSEGRVADSSGSGNARRAYCPAPKSGDREERRQAQLANVTMPKHAARDERVAAQRAERANVDLQVALDRLRDELVATKTRIDTLGDEGTQQIALSDQEK